MPEPVSYFGLHRSKQAQMLRDLFPILGQRPAILEKDIWLCQTLEILFNLPQRKPMAFKGGTSLSKVYHAIERFSEDIDVTIDYQSLIPDVPDDLTTLSNTRRRKLSDALKSALAEHVNQELVPALKNALTDAFPIKQAFFRSSYSHYEKCLTGDFKLIPPEPQLHGLHVLSFSGDLA